MLSGSGESSAWKERIRIEDKSARLVSMQLAATKTGEAFFAPADASVFPEDRLIALKYPPSRRFAGKAQMERRASDQRREVLPHVLSPSGAKKEKGRTSPQRQMSRSRSRSPTKARAGFLALNPGQHGLTKRLNRIEESLDAERQGRMEVQDQLSELKNLLVSRSPSPGGLSSLNVSLSSPQRNPIQHMTDPEARDCSTPLANFHSPQRGKRKGPKRILAGLDASLAVIETPPRPATRLAEDTFS